MLVDPRVLTKEILREISALDGQTLGDARRGDAYEIPVRHGVVHVRRDECTWTCDGVHLAVTDKDSVAYLRDEIAKRVLRTSKTSPLRNVVSKDVISGLLHAETAPPAQVNQLCSGLLKDHYSHDDVFGSYCFLADHIAAPYDQVVDYCANPLGLVEWTMNIRNLVPHKHDLWRGQMIFSADDVPKPTTDIYIRAEVARGAEQSLICYPCAWDQGEELWMRYYFILADAERTLAKSGTVVLWVNCKHPYYERSAAPVPSYIEQGRTRTDRPWAGDAWALFYPLHRLELNNLKRILEHRASTRGELA